MEGVERSVEHSVEHTVEHSVEHSVEHVVRVAEGGVGQEENWGCASCYCRQVEATNRHSSLV